MNDHTTESVIVATLGLLVMFFTAGNLPGAPRRISLRGLFGLMTLFALVLGLIAVPYKISIS